MKKRFGCQLPENLVEWLRQWSHSRGLVMEDIVAAAILHVLRADANERDRLVVALHGWIHDGEPIELNERSANPGESAGHDESAVERAERVERESASARRRSGRRSG